MVFVVLLSTLVRGALADIEIPKNFLAESALSRKIRFQEDFLKVVLGGKFVSV